MRDDELPELRDLVRFLGLPDRLRTLSSRRFLIMGSVGLLGSELVRGLDDVACGTPSRFRPWSRWPLMTSAFRDSLATLRAPLYLQGLDVGDYPPDLLMHDVLNFG